MNRASLILAALLLVTVPLSLLAGPCGSIRM